MLKRELVFTYMPTPIGDLLIVGEGETLSLVSFPTGSRTKPPPDGAHRNDSAFTAARQQLAAYFAGELKQFDVPLQLNGTAFQNKIWTVLMGIPFGETTSYGALAKKVGSPKASRAVGAANGANPIPIIIPCHRVIGANKSLTGFGGGLETKQFLLEHEGVLAVQPSLF